MTPISLLDIAAAKLDEARRASSGRAAQTVHGGRDRSLRHTVLALAAGRELAEHDNPGRATLQVLTGRLRLSAESGSCYVRSGDLVTIPPQRHAQSAITDSGVVLTVVTGSHQRAPSLARSR